MREEGVSLGQKEQQRVMVLNRIERGELTGREAVGLGEEVRKLVVVPAQGPYVCSPSV